MDALALDCYDSCICCVSIGCEVYADGFVSFKDLAWYQCEIRTYSDCGSACDGCGIVSITILNCNYVCCCAVCKDVICCPGNSAFWVMTRCCQNNLANAISRFSVMN